MQVNLFLLEKDGTAKVFSLPSAVTLIGRRHDCDLCIPLSVISRKHCEINTDQNRLMIRDLHSKNGTFVNGQRVEESRLNPGDQLHLGDITFVVQIDGIPLDMDIASVEPIKPIRVSLEDTEDRPQQQERPDELPKDLGNIQLGSSHTAEIPDIISDDLNPQGS